MSHSVTQGLTREVHDGGGEGAGVQKSKRQLAAHRGTHVGVREGEFDPVWSRPPVPTLEVAVSVTRLPQALPGRLCRTPSQSSLVVPTHTQPPYLWPFLHVLPSQ